MKKWNIGNLWKKYKYVGLVVLAVLGLALWKLLRDKKRGKGSCSCGGGCPGCSGSCTRCGHH